MIIRKSQYKIKKQWNQIIPKLNVENIPFRYVNEIKMFMTNGEIVVVKNKKQFDVNAKEYAKKDIWIKNVNFSIKYDRLIRRIETLFQNALKED